MQDKTKSRLSIIAIFLLFFTPVIITILLNSNLINFKPTQLKNNGNLIQPAVKFPFQRVNEENIWTLVYFTSERCQEKCLKGLELIHKVRLTRGHKMKKVKLLLVNLESDTFEMPESLSHIERIGVKVNSDQMQVLQELSTTSLTANEGLFILAPEGFLMMSYAENFTPQHVIKDLSLLLRGRKGE